MNNILGKKSKSSTFLFKRFLLIIIRDYLEYAFISTKNTCSYIINRVVDR